MDSLRLQITRKMQYIVGSLRKIITCVRANVATMGHLNIITYNSKAATTSQLKFGVHKQLLIGAGYGYFNSFTTSYIKAEGISYVMLKFFYETGVSVIRHHITTFTVNDPFVKDKNH